ncbi:MAG: sugar phosphate isomerase/epimerase [Lentisphaeria bacterium]|nr:sugar phosphate isomerase/epimerase [Lentisphaeria bacterium]
MFFTGFADEAGADIDVQIKATKELGWKYIETRNINGKNLSTLTDAEFDSLCEKLDNAGVAFNCYGSSIANWGMDARSDEAFEMSKKLLFDAIPRMHKLNIKLLRAMSFRTAVDEEPDKPELEKIIFAKVNELVKICEDNGIVYGHENCMNYGGLSHLHTLKLLDNVKSKAFTLIYDTGNPVFNYRRIGNFPYALQSSWEFYHNVKEFISYVHIKDGTAVPTEDGKTRPACKYCWAGDGNGDVRAILIDLLKNGYDGGFSMEPHVAAVFHDASENSSNLAEIQYSSYVEYGRRFEKMLNEIKNDIK